MRKGTKFLSLLLTAALLAGMLPAAALAAEVAPGFGVGAWVDPTAQDESTGSGYRELPGGEAGTADGAVSVSKAAEYWGDGRFGVELTVTTKEELKTLEFSPDAAVVLVVDVSLSMNTNSRLASVKDIVAGKDGFLDSFADVATDAKRMVSIVTFGANAKLVPVSGRNWVDVSANGTGAANLSGAKKAINDLRTSGNTNLEGGMLVARNLLTDSSLSAPVKDIKNRYVVLLTDGVPTADAVNGDNLPASTSATSYKALSSSSGDVARERDCNNVPDIAEAIKTAGGSRLMVIGYGDVNSKSVPVSGQCQASGWHQHRNETGGTTGKWSGNAFSAHYDKDGDVASGHSNRKGKPNDGCTADWYNGSHSTADSTVASWMQNTVKVHQLYSPENADDLMKSFENITETIALLAQAWTVTDPMGPFVEPGSVQIEQKGSDIASCDAAKTPNVLTWNLLEDTATPKHDGSTTYYTYKLSYTFLLNNKAQGFEEGKPYPANGKTTLTYVILEDGKTVDQVTAEDLKYVDFPVPTVYGPVPTVPFKVETYKLPLNTGDETGKYQLDRTLRSGTVKLWTALDVTDSGSPAYYDGYETLYADDSTVNVPYHLVASTTAIVAGQGENVIKLYYAPDTAAVTVNHHYRETYFDESGALVEPEYGSGDHTSTVTVSVPGPNAAPMDWVYVNQRYTATLRADSYTLDAEKDNIQSIERLSADSAANVLNLYYTRPAEDSRGDATLEVYHVYETERWALNPESGRYEKTVDTSEPAPQSTENTKAGVQRSVSTPAESNGYLYLPKDGEVTGASDVERRDGSLTMKLGEGKNTVTLTFRKDAGETPDAKPAVVNVTHTYTKSVTTVDDLGGVHVDTAAAPDDYAEISTHADGTPLYAGESFTLEDLRPVVGEEAYTRVSADEDLTIAELLERNSLTVRYDLTESHPRVEATVTHIYEDYHYVPVTETVVNPETGEETEVVTGYNLEPYTDEETPEPFVENPSVYVGQTFAPAPHAVEDYTRYDKDGSPTSITVSAEGDNTVTLYYFRISNPTERLTGTVTVRHTYISNTIAVYGGEVDTRPIQDHQTSLENPAGDDTYTGYPGETFTPTEKTGYEGMTGESYRLTSGGTGPVTIHSGTNPTIELVYERDVTSLTESLGLTVNYHYADFQMYLDENGSPAYPDVSDRTLYTLDETNSGPVELKDLYAGVKVDIPAWPGLTGEYTPDSGNPASVVLSADGKTVDLYFYSKTPLPKVAVTVEHWYTYSYTDALGNEHPGTPEKRGEDVVISDRYEGQSVKVDPRTDGYDFGGFTGPEGAVLDGQTNSAAFPAQNITVRYDYVKHDDFSKNASYTVNYYYQSLDWDQEPDETKWVLDADRSYPVSGLYATNTGSAAPVFRVDDDGSPIGDELFRVETTPEECSERDGVYSIVLEEGDGNSINFYLFNRYDSRVKSPVLVNYVYNRYDSRTGVTTKEYGFTTSVEDIAAGAYVGSGFSVGAAGADGVFAVDGAFDKPSYDVTGGGETATVNYAFSSVNPASGEITVQAQGEGANPNQITLTYLRTQDSTTYVVVREFRYGGAVSLTETSDPVAGEIGSVVDVMSLAAATEARDGVTYSLLSADPADGLTLAADPGANVVRLVYGYTPPVTPPVEPPVEPPVNPPVNPPVEPPVNPPVNPPVEPPVTPPTEPEEPTIEIPEEDIPLADLPGDDDPTAALPPEINDELIILDEDVPLGDLPQTGTTGRQSHAGFGLLLSMSALSAGLALLVGRKRKENQ